MSRYCAPDTRSIFGHLALAVLLELEDELNIVVRIPRGDMKMKMKHGLPRDFAVIGEDIESRRVERIDDGAGDDVGREDDIGKFRGGNVDKRQRVSLWYDRHMSEVYRINIQD